MKKQTLKNAKTINAITGLLCLCLYSFSAQAQIPNNGFENWTNMGAYEVPDDWGTMNNTTEPDGIYTATKASPGNPGNFYMKLTSKTIGSGVVNGIAVSGKLDSVTMLPISGFAYTDQPVSFTGKWQHMIYGSSQGSLSATLTRWDIKSNERVTVATANQTLSGMAMSWATFNIPFVYTDEMAPDSCIIFLKASGSNPTNLDYLWVDNLSFTGSVAGLQDHTFLAAVDVFPNPTTENFQVNIESKELQEISIVLVNTNGEVIYNENMTAKEGLTEFIIPTNGFAKGNYMLRISSGSSRDIRSVIIQ